MNNSLEDGKEKDQIRRYEVEACSLDIGLGAEAVGAIAGGNLYEGNLAEAGITLVWWYPAKDIELAFHGEGGALWIKACYRDIEGGGAHCFRREGEFAQVQGKKVDAPVPARQDPLGKGVVVEELVGGGCRPNFPISHHFYHLQGGAQPYWGKCHLRGPVAAPLVAASSFFPSSSGTGAGSGSCLAGGAGSSFGLGGTALGSAFCAALSPPGASPGVAASPVVSIWAGAFSLPDPGLRHR